MTKYQKLKHCAGCYNDFYNGHNPYDVQECWSLKTAKLIWRKKVGLWQNPPWKQKAERYLSCYRQQGSVFVGPKQEY